MESEHPTLQYSDVIPEEFDDPNHHAALAFDYFAEAYEAFFAGSDIFEGQQRKIEERYGVSHGPRTSDSLTSAAIARKNARIETDLEEQKAEVAKLRAELEKLQSIPVRPWPKYLFQSSAR